MSETRRSAMPSPEAGADSLPARLAALRAADAWRVDPAGFHYLEALARRIPGQPEPVRRLLQDKLQSALFDYAGRLAATQPAAGNQTGRIPDATCAPLARLNDYIRSATSARVEPEVAGEPQEPEELESVRRFKRAWRQGHTRDQVEQAVARKPANAGPLNSHVLVLQSLAMLQELSPDYLRRFVVHVESLQWLDQARGKFPLAPAKQTQPARRGRQKK